MIKYTLKYTSEFKRQMKLCQRRGYDIWICFVRLLRYFPQNGSCLLNICLISCMVIVKGSGSVISNQIGC